MPIAQIMMIVGVPGTAICLIGAAYSVKKTHEIFCVTGIVFGLIAGVSGFLMPA